MNLDSEIVGWRIIIEEHESLKALRLCAIIQLVVAIIGSCGVYKQWKQSGNFVRNPTDWLAAGINVGVLTSGLCGTISLHFGEQSIPLYQLYQAFIALNFIGCIAATILVLLVLFSTSCSSEIRFCDPKVVCFIILSLLAILVGAALNIAIVTLGWEFAFGPILDHLKLIGWN